jgi:carbon storage regulator
VVSLVDRNSCHVLFRVYGAQVDGIDAPVVAASVDYPQQLEVLTASNLHINQGRLHMLVLSRKKNTRILIGDNIVVTIVEVRGETVKVGIDAPRELNIIREELIGIEPSDKNQTSQSVCDKTGQQGLSDIEPSNHQGNQIDTGSSVRTGG